MNHRWLSIFFLGIIVFSACQPSDPGVPTSRPKPTSTTVPVESSTPAAVSKLGVDEEALDGLVVEVWYPWNGAPAELFESQIVKFNENNPWGIQVRGTGQGNYTELYTRMGPALHGADRPDVIIGLPEYAVEWHNEAAALDLNPYVSDPVYGLSGTQIADFPVVFWEQDQLGNVQLAMPAQRTARFMLYNQSWAEELGFDKPPTNANEFQEQACKANRAMRSDEDPGNDGQGGWLIDTHPITNLSWLLAFGGGAQESESFRFLRPENIEATRFIKGLAEDGCAWKSQSDNPLSNFANRTALFAVASLEDLPGLARDFAHSGNKDEWTVLPFPGSESNVLVVYGASYILFKSDEPDQLGAWLFVRWLLEPENQAEWVKAYGLFPLQTTTMSLLSDYSAGHPAWAEAVQLLPQGRITPQLAEWRRVRVALGDGFAFMFRVDTPVGQVAAVLAQLDAIVTDLSP
jgi:ABC-type glycerol-3-phosphate transport system substrate-binding protein